MARKRHPKHPGPTGEPSVRERSAMASAMMKAQQGKEKTLSNKLENRLARRMGRGASKAMKGFSAKMPMLRNGAGRGSSRGY